jgi:hypothetical protein
MSFPDTHYHIRWFPSSLLDWQAFASREEAETAAKELVRESETYIVEVATVGCKRCLEIVGNAVRRQAAHDLTRTKAHRA